MNAAFFMAYGLFLWLLCIFDLIKTSKNMRRMVAYMIILSFAVYAAGRSMEVSDTIPYSNYFETIRKDIIANGFFTTNGRFEIGFEYLTKILALLTTNVKVYFFSIAFINACLAYNIFCDKNYIILPLVIYISFFGFYFAFVILRAGLSILCFCYGVLKGRKKIIKLFISFGFAFAFHNSAIVAIILYFISRIGKKNISFSVSFVIILISFSLYASELFIKLLNTKIIYYFEGLNITNKIWLKGLDFLKELAPIGQFRIAKRFIFNIIIYLGTKYVISNSPLLKSERNLQIIDRLYIIAFVMIGLLGNGTLIGRISDYLLIFNIVYLKITFTMYQKYKYNIYQKNNLIMRTGKGVGTIMTILLCVTVLNMIFVYRLLILPV